MLHLLAQGKPVELLVSHDEHDDWYMQVSLVSDAISYSATSCLTSRPIIIHLLSADGAWSIDIADKSRFVLCKTKLMLLSGMHAQTGSASPSTKLGALLPQLNWERFSLN